MDEGPERPCTITVKGSGAAAAKANVARLQFTIDEEDLDAQVAHAKAVRRVERLLEMIRNDLPGHWPIKSVVDICEASYPFRDEDRGFSYWTATAFVEVETPKLESLAAAARRAMAVEADSIYGLEFDLADYGEVRASALRLATQDAHGRAEAIAETLGAQLGPIVSITDDCPGTRHDFSYSTYEKERLFKMGSEGGRQPSKLVPSTIVVREAVTVVFELAA